LAGIGTFLSLRPAWETGGSSLKDNAKGDEGCEANVNKKGLRILWGIDVTVSLQPAIKKGGSSSLNGLIFIPDNSTKVEINLARNKKACTFALP
jgi:hypothetical protein